MRGVDYRDFSYLDAILGTEGDASLACHAISMIVDVGLIVLIIVADGIKGAVGGASPAFLALIVIDSDLEAGFLLVQYRI